MPKLALMLVAVASLQATGCSEDTACGPDHPCPRGSSCLAGECRSECDPAAPACPAGGSGTRDGRCAHAEPDPAANVCAAMVLDAEFGTPTLVVLVDQSASMSEPYSGDTRWSVLREALIDPDTGVITALQASVRFGLTLYTNSGGPTCPELTTVAPALVNRDAIAAVYDAAQPEADTPTGESIAAVVAQLVAFSEPGPKYIIVASDGEPDTCAVPNPQTGQPEAVAAAQQAFAAGITLYFLSVGAGTISQQHLQDMANAGVGFEIGGSQDAPFYEAGDADQLAAAFAEITGTLLTCELKVNGSIDPAAVETGIIYLDGNQLALNDANGWELIDESTFRLLGSSCSEAQRAGAHTVTAEFACDAAAASSLRATGGGPIDGGCAALSGLGPLAALAVISLLRLRRRG